ncbi:MAG: choice-of-anchor J domain-containing protein [Clostridia bacterium]|nr:choice-of-anchor J domain-containing protein [Clostridia bacterium]
MKRILSIIIAVVMLGSLFCIPATAKEKNTLNVDIPQRSVEKLPEMERKKLELQEDYMVLGYCANTTPSSWFRFNVLDLNSIDVPKTSSVLYAASCFNGTNTLYLMTYESKLYKCTYVPTIGVISDPTLVIDFSGAQAIGTPTEMCYDEDEDIIYIVYNARYMYRYYVFAQLQEMRYISDVEYGVVAMDIDSRGNMYSVDASGYFGTLDPNTGVHTPIANTGLSSMGGTFYIQSGCMTPDNNFIWNYTNKNGQSSLVILSTTSNEGAALGGVGGGPGAMFHGMAVVAEPVQEITAPLEFDIFYENWEQDFTVSRWKVTDEDGDGNFWTVDRTPSQHFWEDGEFAAISPSTADDSALSPKDWLISPSFKIPANSPAYLSYWIGANYPAVQGDPVYESYSVYVAEEGVTELSEFTRIFSEELTEAGAMHKELDLSEYAGETISIAICHDGTGAGQRSLILDAIGVGTEHSFHSVTFIDTFDNSVLSEQQVRHGKYPEFPRKPKHENCTCTGWDYEGKIYEDMVISTVYEYTEYEINYYVDGEYYYTEWVPYGSVIELLDYPVKPGYEFSGWSEVPETMPAENLEVYGTFSPAHICVTFVDGLTQEVISTFEYTYGEELVYPEPPVHEGYVFTGWDKTDDVTESCTITALYAPEGELGDVNGDGIVNTGDAVLILKYAAELVTLDTTQLTLADTTGDGTVNTGDAVLILKYAAGLIEKF